jgi:general secretion pathway protein G
MTLVEILAVVVILGILAATLAVSFSGSFGKAKHELAKTGIGQLVDKLEAYRVEKSSWPSNDLGLKVLSTGYATPSDSYYVEPSKLLDPWNHPYFFVTPGPDLRPYEILTYGADGQPGGSGEDADVSSADLRKN